MFKTIDQYIIKKYLGTFLYVVLLFSMISVVIDFGERIKRLIESELPLIEIFTSYYLPFIPWINSILWPLYGLITVIFFTSRLANNSEIIAVFNSGTSFYRMAWPYLIASGFLSSIHWAANHYWLPKTNKDRIAFYNNYISNKKIVNRNRDIHLFVDPSTKVYINYYNKRDSMAQGFRIESFADHTLVAYLQAKSAKLYEAPNKWRLNSYVKRSISPDGHHLIVARGQSLDTTLQLFHSDFIKFENDIETMTTPELKSAIAREEARGIETTRAMTVAIYKRHAEPITLIILTIIGLAVAGRKKRGGFGINIAIGLILGSTYIIISRFSETFSVNQELSIGWIMWLPNIIFGLIAVLLVLRAQK